MRSATSVAAASASGAVASPATTSTSRISGGGLKKCMPQTRSGRSAPAAIAVTESEEVLVASTASGRADPLQGREQLALELEPLGRRLDHQLAAGEVGELRRRGQSRAAAASASAAVQRPRSAPRARSARSLSLPRSSASGSGS